MIAPLLLLAVMGFFFGIIIVLCCIWAKAAPSIDVVGILAALFFALVFAVIVGNVAEPGAVHLGINEYWIRGIGAGGSILGAAFMYIFARMHPRLRQYTQ